MDVNVDERRPSPRPRRHKQRGTVVDIVISSLLVLLALALFVAGLNFDGQSEAESKQFVDAPLCTSSDVDSPTCRLNALMLVTDKWDMSHSSHHVVAADDHGYYLDLRSRSGETYQAEFRRPNHLWKAMSPGETVEAQVWQDRVVSVTADTYLVPTVTNPGPTSQTLHHFFGVVTGLLLLLALSFLVSVIKRTSRGQ